MQSSQFISMDFIPFITEEVLVTCFSTNQQGFFCFPQPPHTPDSSFVVQLLLWCNPKYNIQKKERELKKKVSSLLQTNCQMVVMANHMSFRGTKCKAEVQVRLKCNYVSVRQPGRMVGCSTLSIHSENTPKGTHAFIWENGAQVLF